MRSEIVAEWMSEYLLAVVLLKLCKLMEHATNQGIIEWGIDIRDSGNQVSVLGLGFLRKNTTRTHKENFLCQFCAISLQKQAIFGDMWQ